MQYRIGLIHGDGIGPEIVGEAQKVLDALCEKYGHVFRYTRLLLGGASIDVHGVPADGRDREGGEAVRRGADGLHRR